jgi:tape measure domain-containing protein
MTTERIDIVVSEKGARVVRRNIENIGKGADVAGNALRKLQGLLRVVAGGAALTALVRLVDTFTNLQNRLRLVTTGVGGLNVVTEKLFGIANRTRSSFEGTAEVFARTALALKDLGTSQQETLNFTESLNQAIILSGASAQESQAGLIQLSQGLASGALRGDELRSVLEQLPAVADVIAKGLGITRGELRELGTQGKITADIILESFKDAREELAEKFATTIPTIGQSLGVLKNSFIEFLGNLNTATGASEALARIILVVADNMETLGRIIGAVSIVLGVVFARQAIGAAVTGMKTLAVLIAANPIGALATAALIATSALVAFGDQITISAGSLVTLQDFGSAVFDTLAEGAKFFAEVGQAAFVLINDEAASQFGGVELSFEGIVRAGARGADGLIGIFVGAYKAIVASFGLLPNAFKDIFTRALNGAIGLVESGINRISGALSGVLQAVGLEGIGSVTLSRLENASKGGAAELGKVVGNAFKDGFDNTNVVGDTVDTLFKLSEAKAQERIAKQQLEDIQRKQAEANLGAVGKDLSSNAAGKASKGPTFAKELDQLRQENTLLKLNSDERLVQSKIFEIENTLKRTLTDTEKGLITSLVQENQALEIRSGLLNKILRK